MYISKSKSVLLPEQHEQFMTPEVLTAVAAAVPVAEEKLQYCSQPVQAVFCRQDQQADSSFNRWQGC